jgi:hypothetical protein
MRQKILTPETITRMIPLVQRIADDLERAYAEASRILASLDAPARGDDAAAGDEALDELQRCVNELEALGGTLRSYEPVRVDFISEVDGEIGYVCWESGDVEPMHFHGAMEHRSVPILNA